MTQKFIEIKDEVLKQIIPEYLNTEYIRQPEYMVFRSDKKHNRFYLKVEEFKDDDQIIQQKTFIAPSVTSIISACAPTDYGLLKWYAVNGLEYCSKFLDDSANYGTFIHACYKDIILGKKFILDDLLLIPEMKFFYEENNMDFYSGYKWYQREGRDIKKDLFGFVRFLKDYEVKPLAVEMTVFNELEKYAGTLDLACYMTIKDEKIIAIVDFKTGYNEYVAHAVQLEGLKRAWNLSYPDLKVERVFDLYSKDFRMPLKDHVPPYSLEENTDNKNMFLWDHYVNIFNTQISADKEKYAEFKPVEIGFDIDIPIDFMNEKGLFDDVLESIKINNEPEF